MTVSKQQLPSDYEVLLSGTGAYDIVIKSKVKADLLKRATSDQRAELDGLVRRYAAEGPAGLPRTKFSGKEGWFPSSKAQGKIRLEAFKPWKLRAYGFCCNFNDRPTFFITGDDPVKKQDEANQSVLKAAGKEAHEISKLLNKKGGKDVAVQKPRRK